jgi:hypothetical protein
MDVTNAAVPESPAACLWNFIVASLIKICLHIPVFGSVNDDTCHAYDTLAFHGGSLGLSPRRY